MSNDINQCDGCMRGLPIEDGIHMDGDRPVQTCEKALYGGPPPGSWADVARMMASLGGDDGIDWDAWKDEMKETDGEGY